jgi:hypothetical protein
MQSLDLGIPNLHWLCLKINFDRKLIFISIIENKCLILNNMRLIWLQLRTIFQSLGWLHYDRLLLLLLQQWSGSRLWLFLAMLRPVVILFSIYLVSKSCTEVRLERSWRKLKIFENFTPRYGWVFDSTSFINLLSNPSLSSGYWSCA